MANYEQADAKPRIIGLSALSLAAMVIVALGAGLLLNPRDDRAASRRPGAPTTFEGGPRARSSIAQDWSELDRSTAEHLTTYGWVDRSAGVVRIPIEHAMELTAQRAAPAENDHAP